MFGSSCPLPGQWVSLVCVLPVAGRILGLSSLPPCWWLQAHPPTLAELHAGTDLGSAAVTSPDQDPRSRLGKRGLARQKMED